MRKIILLILLPFAYMVRVEAQTLAPTIDGYFNPIGNYEYNGLSPDGWSAYSSILGWHENADGSIEVFTNFDTLAGQFIDYAFTIDGENWYPSSEEFGTYGVIENVFAPGDRFTYGTYGVKNSQGQVVVPIEWWPYGSMFTNAWVDETNGQVVLIQQKNDDPEYAWDFPDCSVLLWNGSSADIVCSGLTTYLNQNNSILKVPDQNAVFVGGGMDGQSEFPSLVKIDLSEKMVVPFEENEQPPLMNGLVSVTDMNYFMGYPVIHGWTAEWGGFISLITENGWDEVYTPDFVGNNMISISPDGSTLFALTSETGLDHLGDKWISAISFTTDMYNWDPVVDKNGLYSTDAQMAIMLWSKGVMWILGKKQSSFHLMNEEDSFQGTDVYVLKDTYTPYTEVSEERPSGFLVHPNPATESFQYGLPFKANLASIEGKIVKTINENESSVDVRDIPSGIYILTLTDGSTSKIVVTH